MTADRFILSRERMHQQLEPKVHPLDPGATRRATSLGDLTGLTRLGVHYTVLRPGEISSLRHRHRHADEFIVVLEGAATLRLDDDAVTIRAGDFVGLPARGPSHTIHNEGASDFVYIVGGNRLAFDVTEYPTAKKRAYLYDDGDVRKREVVDDDDVEAV